MNTTIRKLSLRQEATEYLSLAKQVLINADKAYQDNRTLGNLKQLQQAIAAYKQAKADAEAAGYSYKYVKGTVPA